MTALGLGQGCGQAKAPRHHLTTVSGTQLRAAGPRGPFRAHPVPYQHILQDSTCLFTVRDVPGPGDLSGVCRSQPLTPQEPRPAPRGPRSGPLPNPLARVSGKTSGGVGSLSVGWIPPHLCSSILCAEPGHRQILQWGHTYWVQTARPPSTAGLEGGQAVTCLQKFPSTEGGLWAVLDHRGRSHGKC